MEKVKIKVIILGHLPFDFNKRKIERWKSHVFEIQNPIENYALSSKSDGQSWEYSDEIFEKEIPDDFDEQFLIAIVNVPLDDNWYSRRLTKNRVVFSFYEIKDILHSENIPIENVIFRILYAYTLVYKCFGNKIPEIGSSTASFTHDDSRGCLFDMNGIKTDIKISCNMPIICSECYERFRQKKVSTDVLEKIIKEIKNIKKGLFYQIRGFIKIHPVMTLVISSIYAILLGVIGSLIGTLIWSSIMGD